MEKKTGRKWNSSGNPGGDRGGRFAMVATSSMNCYIAKYKRMNVAQDETMSDLCLINLHQEVT